MLTWGSSVARANVTNNMMRYYSFLCLVSLCLVKNGVVLGFSGLTSSSRVRSFELYSVPSSLDVLTSGLASICRLPNGMTVCEQATSFSEKERPIIKRYYLIENNSDCRKVSEKLTELDLVVQAVIPASAKSRAVTDADYKYALPKPGMKAPILVIEEEEGSQAQQILEGKDSILDYFGAKYGLGVNEQEEATVKEQALRIADALGNPLATLFRIGRGVEVSSCVGSTANRPAKPLVLYDYSANQFSRLVREVLMELDLVYELRSAGKESPRRKEMAEVTGGSTQCPYLMDPNTNVSMKESADIVQYLYHTYALYTPPSELLQWASENVLSLAKPILSELAKLQAGAKQEDQPSFEADLRQAKKEIEQESNSAPVVVYTYEWSPFSWETKSLLERLNIPFTEISLGKEWLPGLIGPGGAAKRNAFLELTGQSSLPQIYVGGKSIGGLFSGTPGLVPALEQGLFKDMVDKATKDSD